MTRKTALRIGAIALAIALFAPITHMKISSRFVLEPIQRAEIRTQEDGFIEKVLVQENDLVKPGQALAHTRNDDLMENVRRLDSRLSILNQELSLNASQQASSELQMKFRQKEQLIQEKSEAEQQVAKLILKTPIPGTVVTPRFENSVGSYAPKGSLVCVVANLDKVRVRIPVREYDIDDVKVDQDVLLKFAAYPSRTFTGKVEKISPAGTDRVESLEGNFMTFNVDVLMNNQDKKLVPGMQGFAKIVAARHSIAFRMVRELSRGVQSIVW